MINFNKRMFAKPVTYTNHISQCVKNLTISECKVEIVGFVMQAFICKVSTPNALSLSLISD